MRTNDQNDSQLNYLVEVQLATHNKTVPSSAMIEKWVQRTLSNLCAKAEVCVRIVDELEIQQLNLKFRHIDKPTNVLSFPADLANELQLEYPMLGDIIICAPIVEKEAKQQQKSIHDHWVHMVVHGVLHLLGFDHAKEQDALRMERLEIAVLQRLGFADPYGEIT